MVRCVLFALACFCSHDPYFCAARDAGSLGEDDSVNDAANVEKKLGSSRGEAAEAWKTIETLIKVVNEMQKITTGHTTRLTDIVNEYSQNIVKDYSPTNFQGVLAKLTSNPLAYVTVAVDTLEQADEVCRETIPNDFSGRLWRWSLMAKAKLAEKLGLSDPREREEREAQEKQASNTIHAISQQFSQNLNSVMQHTLCPVLEQATVAHAEKVAADIATWETQFGRSWYLVSEMRSFGVTQRNQSTVVASKCLTPVQENHLETHLNEQGGSINHDIYGQLESENGTGVRHTLLIDAQLALLEEYLEDLNRFCDVPDFVKTGRVPMNSKAKHLLSCEVSLVFGQRWERLLQMATGASGAAAAGDARQTFVSRVMNQAIREATQFNFATDMPSVKALGWAALRLAKDVEVKTDCIRFAALLSSNEAQLAASESDFLTEHLSAADVVGEESLPRAPRTRSS